MFILVQAHQYTRYQALMDQAFRLRKRVFHDQLGWAVTIDGDCERDEYDALRPAYLMWSNDRADRLYGTLRLMPTTGPTLLYDVFRDTFAGASLIAPGIYEGTRMCLDEEILSEDFPNLETGRLSACCCWRCANADCRTVSRRWSRTTSRTWRASIVGRGSPLKRLAAQTAMVAPRFAAVFSKFQEEVRTRMQQALGVGAPLYAGYRPHKKADSETVRISA